MDVDDGDLVRRLRSGDEAAFALLVRRHHGQLLRLASSLLPSRAAAEDAVQETWLGVVRGIHGFEGRSSVETWLFRILVNQARKAAAREVRSVPVDVGDERAVPPQRFDHAGSWSTPPAPWTDEVDTPDRREGPGRAAQGPPARAAGGAPEPGAGGPPVGQLPGGRTLEGWVSW